ncbi:hypothetical protein P3555_24635, partial [Vibrio parahaemolyticus]|nr:hypothetical protein [Vibrio parahaemolyticus]
MRDKQHYLARRQIYKVDTDLAFNLKFLMRWQMKKISKIVQIYCKRIYCKQPSWSKTSVRRK